MRSLVSASRVNLLSNVVKSIDIFHRRFELKEQVLVVVRRINIIRRRMQIYVITYFSIFDNQCHCRNRHRTGIHTTRNISIDFEVSQVKLASSKAGHQGHDRLETVTNMVHK